jgi:hypothetical protein
MRMSSVLFVVGVAAVCGSAEAQLNDPGLFWSGSSGMTAGSLCGNFTCTPHQVSVSVNEVVTLTTRGGFGHLYEVGLSASASQCLAIPGVQHSLVLDFPITIALAGVLSEGDPILLCPGGRSTFVFTMPFLPPGTMFSIQAITELASSTPAFTSAITVTVL